MNRLLVVHASSCFLFFGQHLAPDAGGRVGGPGPGRLYPAPLPSARNGTPPRLATRSHARSVRAPQSALGTHRF
ncbi:hypothetical protein VITFI_CDS0771 [Vitreoscilla filiformis]|uniref:Uncharacterized protein n=1 Tax=Vitreoscilla filiformis TaxID=63 RepID=A0A221KCI6_VITFI|nr:hypothetical protein VITFI_CDS0771 [Vitreoscilla filiformis]